MSTNSSLFSPRNFSLLAVAIQATVLAIVLHFIDNQRFNPSSAVLLTELGKLGLSTLLAIRELFSERTELKQLNFHPLPSPSLYAKADEVHRASIYSDDPYDPPPSFMKGLRRRSSVLAQSLSLGISIVEEESLRPPLSKFQFPSSPIAEAAFEKAGVVKVETKEGLRAYVPPSIVGMLRHDVFGEGCLTMALPAILFAVQNNLNYVAARNLSVSVLQITFQLKTLITALAAVVMLGRRLAITQWISLVILAFGVAILQLGAITAKASDSHDHAPLSIHDDANYLAGVSAILVSCFASSIAATYFELVIKRRSRVDGDSYTFAGNRLEKPASLWVRNIQLSLFSCVFGLVVVVFQANSSQLAFWSGGLSSELGVVMQDHHWYDPVFRSAAGFFDGFTPIVWVAITLQAIGGLLIALAIKHADNITKGFALSISIVFTFLLSAILFDFKITWTAVVGAAAVISSTLLYEADEKAFQQLFSRRDSVDDRYSPRPPSLLKRWHCYFLVAILVTFGVAVSPIPHYSVSTAAWDLLATQLDINTEPPSIAIADMGSINSLIELAAVDDCHWGIRTHRQSTQAPYGVIPQASASSPYIRRETDQYALDDILFARISDYKNTQPLLGPPGSTAPDFIFVPILSVMVSNPWGCDSPRLREGIRQTVAFICQLSASIGPGRYPRIVLPIAGIRSNLERDLFTEEIMKELSDTVIVVGIEGALKTGVEAMKHVIDVPYPTRYHLAETGRREPIQGEKLSVGDYFLNHDRPFLLHYAASKEHSWNREMNNPFNGFALRAALDTQLTEFKSNSYSASRILYDQIVDSRDGAQNLTRFAERMSKSIFCPSPPGDSPTCRQFYDALQHGCIPVIFREKSYGRLFPSSPELDPSRYTVFVDENDMIKSTSFETSLIAKLESIPSSEIKRIQMNLRDINTKMQWSLPEKVLYFPIQAYSQRTEMGGANSLRAAKWNKAESTARKEAGRINVDAFSMLLKELDTIKRGNWIGRTVQDKRKGIVEKVFGGKPAYLN